MKQKLLRVLALVAVMLVSTSVYAQTLTLGDFGGTSGTLFDGTNLQNAPMVFVYNHSASQVIYTAEELAQMKGCEITSLSYVAYKSCLMTDEYISNAKVYLQEVDVTEFQKDPVSGNSQWFDVTEGNTIAIALSGLTNEEGDEVIKLELATPYLYTGKNLIVTIVNDSDIFFDETIGVDALTFYKIPGTSTHRTLIFGSESEDFFAAHKTDNTKLDASTEIITNDVPAIQFTYQEATLPEPPAPTYPEALYVVGTLPNHVWDANCADFVLTQSTTVPGIYTGTATIAPDQNNGDGFGYFKLTEKPGAECWNYTYAGSSDGQILALDTPTQITGGHLNPNQNAFRIAGNNEYEFTVDLTNPENMTITAKCNSIQPPVVTYPETLYVVGNLWGHDWDGNCADFVLNQDAQTAGLYKGEVIILPADKGAANGYFKVTAQTGDDWFKYSYAGKTDGEILALDTPTQIWGGAPDGNSNAFQIKANEKYELTVDMTNAGNMTITAKNITPAKGPNTLDVGDYDNTDLIFDGLKISPVCPEYDYSGSQTIYTADELKEMKGKDITKISFRIQNQYYSSCTFNSKLYIQEIDNTEFKYNSIEQKYEWFDFEKQVRAESQKIIDYSTADGDDELVFDLSDFPYSYSGKSLLITMVNFSETPMDASIGFFTFYKYEPTPYRSYKYENYKTDFLNYLNNSNLITGLANPDGTPVVKFTYEDKIFTEVEDAVAAQKHSVTTAAGAIVVNLSEAAMVQVYDIAGHAVAAKNLAEGYNTIEVQKGIYIVKIGNEVHKVCVLN